MSRFDQLIEQLCPNGVRHEALGSVGTLVRGKRFVKADMVSEGVPCLHYGEIYTRYGVAARESFSFLVEEQARSLRYAKPGDVIMVSAGESVDDIGKAVAWLGDEPIVIHDACYAFSSPLDPRFVSYFFSSRLFRDQIRSDIASSKISSVSTQSVARALIPVPPIEVQLEIVRILENFSELEAELESQLKSELETRSIQLTNFRNVVIERLIDDGVHQVAIGGLAGNGFFSDGDWVESKDQDPEGDVRLTQLADVGVGVFRDRSNRWMRLDQAMRLSCTFLEPGDILIARMPDPLGRACQVPNGIGKAVSVVDVAILRSDHADVIARYVMHAINSAPVHNQILSFQTGSTRQRISRKNLARVRIPMPAVKVQSEIVELLDSCDALVNDLRIDLTAELAARRKQYEYYRDKLLTFDEAPA